MCHYLKKEAQYSVSMTRKMQGRKLKRHAVVYKDARFITLFQVHAHDDSKFLLF